MSALTRKDLFNATKAHIYTYILKLTKVTFLLTIIKSIFLKFLEGEHGCATTGVSLFKPLFSSKTKDRCLHGAAGCGRSLT